MSPNWNTKDSRMEKSQIQYFEKHRLKATINKNSEYLSELVY